MVNSVYAPIENHNTLQTSENFVLFGTDELQQHCEILMMSDSYNTTVVTAGDYAYSWGVLLLVASMRMNGMPHSVVVGAMDWNDEMKRLVLSLGHVTIINIPKSRQCVACQKPTMMKCDAVKTDWVCWVDSDGIFVGDCSEWLTGNDVDEMRIKRANPVPPDFTPETLAIWQRDVKLFLGQALSESRYSTRVQSGVILIHKKWRPFLSRWEAQIHNVLPSDVGIIMKKGSAYFQTDESVLSSLLCFDKDAPKVSDTYKFNGEEDKRRYYAHFGYNPKPWQMWNTYASRWREQTYSTVKWLVDNDIIKSNEIPLPLRRNWWPFYQCISPAAPWVWRAIKLKRRIFRK